MKSKIPTITPKDLIAVCEYIERDADAKEISNSVFPVNFGDGMVEVFQRAAKGELPAVKEELKARGIDCDKLISHIRVKFGRRGP